MLLTWLAPQGCETNTYFSSYCCAVGLDRNATELKETVHPTEEACEGSRHFLKHVVVK